MRDYWFGGFICCLGALLLLGSCANEGGTEDSLLHIDLTDAFDVKDEIKLSDIVESIEYIPLKIPAEDSLVLASHGVYETGNFLILRNNQIGYLQFTKDGKFVKKIGKIGKGPEEYEYSNPPLPVPGKNEFICLLPFSQECKWYSFDNGFERKIDTDNNMEDGFQYPNGNILSHQLLRQKDDAFSPLCLLDQDGNSIKELRQSNKIALETGWGVFSCFPLSDKEVLIFGYDYDSLFAIDQDGNERFYGSIDFGKYKASEKLLLPGLGRDTYMNSGRVTQYRVTLLGKFIEFHLYGAKSELVFYSLENGEKYILSSFDEENYGILNDIDGGQNVNPLRTYSYSSDYAYTHMEAADLLLNYEAGLYDREFSDPKARERLLKLIESLDLESNPVVVKLKLRK